MIRFMQTVIEPWLASFKHYVAMSLLLSSPEHLPANPFCIVLTIGCYFALGLFLVNEQYSYAAICAQTLIELGILAGIAYAVLRWRDKLSRLTQTYSALTGVNLVIASVTIPLYYLITNRQDGPDALAITIWILTVSWNLAAISLIFKRAFDISIQLSAMISFNYFVVNWFIVVLLFR